MALDDKREQLSSSRIPEMPKEKAPAPEPKKEIDNSAWKGGQHLKSESLKNWARSNEALKKINLPQSERLKICNELLDNEHFGKFGNYLTKDKAEKTLKGLQKERAYANTDLDRKRLDKEIKVAKSILGK